jgi:hypothetical protein
LFYFTRPRGGYFVAIAALKFPPLTRVIIRETRQELRAQSRGPSARLRESTIPSLFFDWFS